MGHPGLPMILLSRRGPVTFSGSADGGRPSRGAGGVVTALMGVARHATDAVWVYIADGPGDVDLARQSAGSILRLDVGPEPQLLGAGETSPDELRVRIVEITNEVHRQFYEVISNPLLWFVHHRLHGLAQSPTFGRDHRAAFEHGYVAANRLAADVVIDLVRDAGGRAIVSLHDYHFYLAGALIRQACPAALLSHFVHSPWPSHEAWRTLPRDMYRRLMHGLLSCDVVAFQTRADARSFLLCAEELLGLPVDWDSSSIDVSGRTVRARTYPISIDVAALEELASSPATEGHVKELKGTLRDRAVVLRVDRADPNKNIVRGFEAFDLMLQERPDLAGRVVFLAVLQPSRLGVGEYADYLDRIGATAARVNARHGTGDWQPIDLRFAADLPLAVAAYRCCDVLFTNTVADGMNLVAKEAVVVNERDMVLALSDTTGAYAELGQFAVRLDPFDIAQQADALQAALAMPLGERQQRRARAADVVRHNDVHRWIDLQLTDLQLAAEPDGHRLRPAACGERPGAPARDTPGRR